jgi:hypothetical protein
MKNAITIPLGTIHYRIRTKQSNFGQRSWHYAIKAFQRVRFQGWNRRIGWRKLGYVSAGKYRTASATRLEALRAARAERAKILAAIAE